MGAAFIINLHFGKRWRADEVIVRRHLKCRVKPVGTEVFFIDADNHATPMSNGAEHIDQCIGS